MSSIAPMNKPIRTKVIVLGSSGAGKTSFIRRYFHKTFQDERKSTKCADFYSTILPNPLIASEVKDRHKDHFQNTKKRSSQTTLKPINTTEKESNSSKKEDGKDGSKSVKSKKHKKKKHKKKKALNEPSDSKKKESKNKKSNGAVADVVGSSHYIYTSKFVSLQMWDTAGKERLLTKSAGLTSSFGDAFFRHANAAILIYDATSSRSFLQLIKWYSELLQRIERVQSEEMNEDGTESVAWTESAGTDPNVISKRKYEKKRFPVLVVATKLDRLKAEQSKSGNIRTVPQRNVLGLQTGFKGMDYHYEYKVHGADTEDDGKDEKKKPQTTKKTSTNAGVQTESFGKKPASQRMSLSYSLEGGSWAKDREYMDCVRMAEDECFPDRKMVKRWCRRNGLQHVEVSALEDRGVDLAVNTVISLALEETIDREKRKMDEELAAARHRSITNMDGSRHILTTTRSSGSGNLLRREEECNFFLSFFIKLFQR